MGLTQDLKAEARRLGFLLVGIAPANPPPHFQVYESWLQAGRHARMAYLSSERARQRRADPRAILPEAESILMVAAPYLPPERGSLPDSSAPTGQVAAYAWGDDYHDVFPSRLQALVEYLQRRLGRPVPNRWYTDTGPVLERDHAQQAGLGWIGKNTCLIHPRYGSYFLLGELLLGAALEPDPPFLPDQCGTCTRCLEACPTQCILPDRTLDAGRCISYLTIELKGAIPTELRPQLGSWVFGCDVCQQVCPWNQRFAPGEGDPAFAPRPDLPAPDLISELSLTPQEFNQKFKRSPIQRAKRRGYLRNVCVALGNTGDPAAIPSLGAALQNDSEPLVRGHAAWALGQIGGQAARRLLETALASEVESGVRTEIENALQAGEQSPP